MRSPGKFQGQCHNLVPQTRVTRRGFARQSRHGLRLSRLRKVTSLMKKKMRFTINSFLWFKHLIVPVEGQSHYPCQIVKML